MEDERIVPVPVSLSKAEVWCHLGFCGNVPRDRGASTTVSQYIVSQPLYRDTYRIARFLPIQSPSHYTEIKSAATSGSPGL